MSIRSELIDAAVDAVHSSGKVQSIVRDFLNDCTDKEYALEIIAESVGTFRKDMEVWIDNDTDKRKRVNNVINDVSRICREAVGYSIQCKTRKGGEWVYTPVERAPRATPGTPEPSKMDVLIEYVKKNPEWIVQTILANYTYEEFVAIIRNAKANMA